MAYVKPEDIVLIDEIHFQSFMDYREKKNLSTGWDWMHLPLGTMLEVEELIFRTTARWKARKKKDEDGEEYTKRSKGRSCWVKCKIVTPIHLTGDSHTIPSWLLKKAVVSHIVAEKNHEKAV
tara:strand:- start:34 stop:399 length:366 start_codon:yes stop_codon:yes gene_type:complete